MRTLCEVDWPSQQTNWPSEGSFDLQLINPLYQNILNVHPDQIPYISTWKTNVEKNPSWLKACRGDAPQSTVCAVRPTGKSEKPPVIPDPEEEEGEVIKPPPPYAPPTAPPLDPGPQAPGGVGPQPEPPKADESEEEEEDDEEFVKGLVELARKVKRKVLLMMMMMKTSEKL